MTSEPVGGTVPYGVIGAARDIGKMQPARRQRTPREELHTNKVIPCDFAESVTAGATPSADLTKNVAVEVTSR